MIKKLYKIALEIYFHIRPMRIKELFVGTKAWEDYWIKRTKGKDWNNKSKGWIDSYWKSIKHPHRQLVVESVSRLSPKSILEVGCACAPNLKLLADKYPNANICGIDINREAIEYGTLMLKQSGIKNVNLYTQRIDRLIFGDNLFDVVLTDAVLIYIGRDKILKVMKGLVDVAKNGIVLVERHIDGVGVLGVYKDALWQRDYSELIKLFAPKADITIKPISKTIWSEWSETGCIIEAKL